MSKVSTYRSAALEGSPDPTGGVRYSQGSNIVSALPGGLDDAANASAWADTVLLVVGLGSIVEVESHDRTYLTLPQAQQDLVAAVAGALSPCAGGFLVDVDLGNHVAIRGIKVATFNPGRVG